MVIGAGGVFFSPESRFPAGDGPESIAIGDFNSDGNQDLAVVNGFWGNISILLGDGLGSFQLLNTTMDPVNIGGPTIATGLLNRDLRHDLVQLFINLFPGP